MAGIWSPEELAEADAIYSRVLRLLRPAARRFLEAPTQRSAARTVVRGGTIAG